MKKKVNNVFNTPEIIKNRGVKYSNLLEQFIEPFADEFVDKEYFEEIVELAIDAWNFGNLELILPKGETDKMIDLIKDQGIDQGLLKRMIDYKVSHFKEHARFITDYEIEKKVDQKVVLSIMTQEEGAFFENMFEDMNTSDPNIDFEENYVDRIAINVKPLQPFLDWCLNLYPDELDEIEVTNTYLIGHDIENVEAWLRKKFDKIFTFELESWHLNKKEWPQKRNYKMFKEWFQVDVSTMVYDLERKPVSKVW